MQLIFDEASHTYTMDGERVPGTSEVLRAAGLLDAVLNIPAMYRDRGTAVHQWTEADDLGYVTPETEIPAIVLPYLTAWRRFRAESGMQIQAVEELVGHAVYRYATKVDRRVTILGQTWVLNLKSGGAYPHYPYQSALESMCYGVAVRRACVFIDKKAGRCRLVEHTDPRDLAIAKHAIAMYRAARPAEALTRGDVA